MTTYTIRRPGNTAWKQGIRTLKTARKELDRAEKIARGHQIIEERDDGTLHVVDLPDAE